MSLAFPFAPTLGQQYTFAAKTWEWNGETWVLVLAGVPAAIQFKDEGIDLGTSGTVNAVNFVGAGVTAVRAGDAVTVTVPDVATDPIWNAKGDLVVASADNAASRLAVGTNGYVLTADSAEALGVKWAPVAATPGGASGKVQYNNGGAFGGITNLSTDGTNVTAFTMAGAKANFAATAAGYASVNMPHGTAPSSPVDGDLWTTTAGVFARVNGATVGPFAAGGSQSSIQFKDEGTNLGGAGSVDTVDFTGSGVTATRSGNVVTVAVTGGSGGNAFEDVVLSNVPTRYYRLNEASGTTATDSSGNASNGTYNNSPTLNQTSMLYSGAGSAVRFNNGASNQSMTYSGGLSGLGASALVIGAAVINITGASIKGCFFSCMWDGRNFGLGVGNSDMSNSGNNLIAIQQGNAYFNSSVAIGTGNKLLGMAWSKPNNQLYFFIDGVLVHVATTSAATFSGVDCVGGLATGSLAFTGKIQEFATFYMLPSNTVTGTHAAHASMIMRRLFQNFKRGV